MSVTREAGWELTVPGSARSGGSLSSTTRSLRSRSLAATFMQQRRGQRLYREPTLPVRARDEPGGANVSLSRYEEDTRDWRKLHPEDISRLFVDLDASLQTPRNPQLYSTAARRPPEESFHLEGLMAAVAVGNLQASSEGLFWSPCFEEGAAECRGIRAPISRAIAATPDISKLEPKCQGAPSIRVSADASPLAICQELAAEPGHQHVALVRFVPLGDHRGASPALPGNFREAQLQLRTTYLQALREMPKQLHADPGAALEAGALLYTADVTILRGPLEEGAQWVQDGPRVDVITVALQRHPRCDDQGQYARIGDKALVAKAIDHVFACAAANGVDALIFPPPGVGGAAGCHHPGPDAGDLLRKAILAHGHLVPRVWVCKDYRDQLHVDWAAFAAAVTAGRAATEHRELVPLVASPYVRPGWERPGQRAFSRSGRLPWSLRCARAGGQASLGAAGRTIAC